MENIRAKAYKEVYEILKKVSKKDLEKIPKEVLIMLQTNMDKDYKYQVLGDVDFEKQQMLRETKILLAIILFVNVKKKQESAQEKLICRL